MTRRARAEGDAEAAVDAPIALPPARPWEWARSAALWAAGVAWLAPSLSAMTVALRLRPGASLERLNRLYCAGQLKALGIRWRAEVDPAVDPARPYVFVQNHTNHLDHVAMYNATPHFKQGIELIEHFRYPVYGWFMKARGTVGVQRGRGGQTPEVMAQMRAEIGRGHSLLAFPEGTRTTTGRVGRFRRGIFYIARDLGVPVVPVAVTGMYEVMRKGSRLLRPGQVTVHVGAPHPTDGLDDDGVTTLTRRVQGEIAGHVDRHWATRDGEARRG